VKKKLNKETMGGQLADAVAEVQKKNMHIADLEDAILQLKIDVLDQAAVINYLEKKVMK